MQHDVSYPEPAIFRLSAAVFVERDGKILVLKRAGGELTGAWYLPGGAVDEGEVPEQAALRELEEEAGLRPDGGLELIALVPMHVYGHNSIQVTYACSCASGEVILSDEHSGARWVDALDYRERYLNDTIIAAAAKQEARLGELITAVRAGFDEYIKRRGLLSAGGSSR